MNTKARCLIWIFTPIGFFSIAAHANDPALLVVRARVASDLARLRAQYLPALGPTLAGQGTDYEYRALVRRKDFGRALVRMVEGLDWRNFKDKTASQQGALRAELYHRVWSELLDLDAIDLAEQMQSPSDTSNSPRVPMIPLFLLWTATKRAWISQSPCRSHKSVMSSKMRRSAGWRQIIEAEMKLRGKATPTRL